MAKETDHLTKSQLQLWLLGQDAGQDFVELETHLAECEQCSHTLETLEPDNQLGLDWLQKWFRHETLAGEVGDRQTVAVREGNPLSKVSAHYRSDSKDRWELVEKIAQGGIGEIWLANDRLLGRLVAVKRLRPDKALLESVQRRLIYEARIAARLNHPGTVPVLDLIEDGPRSCYVMTLIQGKNLTELIQEFHENVTPKRELNAHFFRLLRCCVAVARTVAFAHSRGVIHRDLKSENVVAGRFGQVTLLDWGLAKQICTPDFKEDEEGRDQCCERPEMGSKWDTQTGSRLGTPTFMSPEQARGDTEATDFRSDTYALAAMLYEVLTGEPPFDGPSMEATMEAVRNAPAIKPTVLKPFVPEFLSQICMKGLEKDPDDRYQTAVQFADEIESWITSEAARKQSEMARRKLFDLSDDLMLILDQSLTVLWANAAWQRFLGWQPRELIGQPPYKLIHPDDLDFDPKILERLARGETASGIELRFCDKQGKHHWISWTATPIADEGLTCAVGRNIDRRIRRQNEFSDLIQSSPDAVVVIDENFMIQIVNSQTQEIFGYRESELVGQPLMVLLPDRMQESHANLIKNYMRAPSAAPITLRSDLSGRHKDGSNVAVSIRISAIKTDSGMRYWASIRQE